MGQACCSGGVPISSNIGAFGVTEKGNWQFSINYDLNVLNTLKERSNKLEDNTRKRTTHTGLAQVGYTITDRFALDAMFSLVRQERLIRPIMSQPRNFTSTNGFGDIVLLLKYRFYKQFRAGLGVKAPTGKTEITDSQGLVLSSDLQPGSGAWDMIYWFSGSMPLPFRKSMTLNGSATYRATGLNGNYLGNQTYEFGNEFQATLGVADRFVWWSKIFDPSFIVKYRYAGTDVKNDFGLPGTGGNWVFLKPGISFNMLPEMSIQTSIELPVHAFVVDTQVTPTYRFNIGFVYLLRNKKNNQNYEIKEIK